MGRIVQETMESGVMMERCLYCGNTIKDQSLRVNVKKDTYPVCCEDCRIKAEEYIEKERRQKVILYCIMFFSAVGYLVIVAFNLKWNGIGAIPICAGIAIMLFPYPVTSYKSLSNCPVKNLIKACKIVGILFAVFGMILCFLL